MPILLVANPGKGQVYVAVGAFDNISNEFHLDAWQNRLENLLQTELQRYEGLKLVERRRLEQILQEQQLQLSGMVDSLDNRAVGQLLGADFILTGVIDLLSGRYRINAKILRVKSGEAAVESVQAPDDDHLVKMVELLANNIAARLTGRGDYHHRIESEAYPTRYFMLASLASVAGAVWTNQRYQDFKDRYNRADRLEDFDRLYDRANNSKKIRTGVAFFSGVMVASTLYYWIKSRMTEDIQALPSQKIGFMPKMEYRMPEEVGVAFYYRF